MPEVDPVIIRIQAIDEATQTIEKITNSLKSIQTQPLNIKTNMGAVEHQIINVTKASKKLADPVREFQRYLDGLEVVPVENLNATLQEAGITEKQFTKFLSQNNLEVIKGVGVYDRLSGAVLTQGQAVKLATLQNRRFKFEWLSILFAGMALDRVFGGLVRAQLDLFGVTQLMSSAWTIVLLPIMEILTPIIYTLLDAFMNLPEPIKIAIGALVLLGAGLGQLMTIGGQVILFLMALKLFGITSFASLAQAVTPFISALLPIAAVIVGIILIVKGLHDIVNKKFQGIGLVIMGIGFILLLFIGWWALIPIAVGAAVYLIIKHWDKIKAFFLNLWAFIKNIFSRYWQEILAIIFPPIGIVALFIKHWEPIKEFFINLWEGVKKIFLGFITWLVSSFANSWNAVKNGFVALGSVFINVWSGIKNTFRGAINFIIAGMNFWIYAFEGMLNIAIRGLNALIKLINKIPGVNIRTLSGISLPRIPSFETGGIMPETGLAYLHAGEKVIPKGQVQSAGGSVVFSPTINLNASVSSDYDVRKLASQLNQYWAAEFQRALKGR